MEAVIIDKRNFSVVDIKSINSITWTTTETTIVGTNVSGIQGTFIFANENYLVRLISN